MKLVEKRNANMLEMIGHALKIMDLQEKRPKNSKPGLARICLAQQWMKCWIIHHIGLKFRRWLMKINDAFRITASLGTLNRHLQESEQGQAIKDLAEHKYNALIRTVLVGDIMELLHDMADDEVICKRIQVSILEDQTAVGEIVQQCFFKQMWNLAEQQSESEILDD